MVKYVKLEYNTMILLLLFWRFFVWKGKLFWAREWAKLLHYTLTNQRTDLNWQKALDILFSLKLLWNSHQLCMESLAVLNLLLKLITILTLQFKILRDSEVKAITVSISQQAMLILSEKETHREIIHKKAKNVWTTFI